MYKLFTNLLVVSLLVFSLEGYAQVGVNTDNPQGVFNVDGGDNNASTGTPSATEQADDFVVTADGSVGIGTTEPDASAFLELDVTELASGAKKGFLGPRVALTAFDDATTIPSPATGLIVFNTGEEPTFEYVGYVFWDGAQWKSLTSEKLEPGTLGDLQCSGASLDPISYTAGTPFDGSLVVPYTNGNGGAYSNQTITTTNGLTATLNEGNFEYGSGQLVYSVSGTPTNSSPTTTDFDLDIGGQTCTAVVGAGKVLQPGELQFFNYEVDAEPENVLLSDLISASETPPILGGKVRIDPYFTDTSNKLSGVSYDSRFYNVHDSAIKVWYASVTSEQKYKKSNILLASGGYVDTDNGLWLAKGTNDDSTDTPRTSVSGDENSAETQTLDFIVDGVWYRITIYIIVDNKNTASDSDNTRLINIIAQRMSGY